MIFMGCCLLSRMPKEDTSRSVTERTCSNAATAIRNLLQRVQASGIQNALLGRHAMLTGRSQHLILRDMEILRYFLKNVSPLTLLLSYGAESTATGRERMQEQAHDQQTLGRDHTFLGESQIVNFDGLDVVKLEG